MALPWKTIARAESKEGTLELRQRGGDYLITVDGRVLMTSAAHRSEVDLARLACAGLPPRARILIGGLGMGYTLRAALDALPANAEVEVAELNADVVAWCRAAISSLSGNALADRRVEVKIGDVARLIREARARYDAIILDLYEGPNASTQSGRDPFYGDAALTATRAALRPGGVFAVWSEDPDDAFERRLARGGWKFTRTRSGKGGRAHVVYLAR